MENIIQKPQKHGHVILKLDLIYPTFR